MTHAPLPHARVLEVLTAAPTLRSAVYQLKTSETRLRKLCRADKTLSDAFMATRARGRAKARSTHHGAFNRCLLPLGPLSLEGGK